MREEMAASEYGKEREDKNFFLEGRETNKNI